MMTMMMRTSCGFVTMGQASLASNERTNFEPFTLDGLKQSVKDDVEIPLVARVLKQVPELEAIDKLFIYLF